MARTCRSNWWRGDKASIPEDANAPVPDEVAQRPAEAEIGEVPAIRFETGWRR